MNRLRVAVIGAGVMGRHHANIYSLIPQVDLVALVDPDPNRRDDAQKNYGLPVYGHIDELLLYEKIDAVSVASPTSTHYALTKQLLESDIHVLVEKPVATKVNQARELIDLSRQRNLVLQVGHITRFYQAVQLLKRRVQNPYLIEARRLTPYARIKDVGVILDLMIHDIDIVLGLVPSPITHTTVAGHLLNGSPFEDVAAAQIVFENGCIARFLASRVAPDAERTLVVAEPTQALRLDFAKEPYTEISVYQPAKDDLGNSHMNVDVRTVNEDNPLKKELEHFLCRIRKDAKPIGTLEDDLRSLTLATRLLDELQLTRVAQQV
jgi:predicted dehydrogenase